MIRSVKGFLSFPRASGFKLEPIGADKWKIVPAGRAMPRVDVTPDMIQQRISYLRDWASEMICQEGKDPAQYQDIIVQAAIADRPYCGARMLERLVDLECELPKIKPNKAVRNAIYYALVLATETHALTIVDNESGISSMASLPDRRGIGNERHVERAREHERWRKTAETWPGVSDMEAARLVKKALHLPDKVPTIAKRLAKKAE
jgi:hypothetical protein